MSYVIFGKIDEETNNLTMKNELYENIIYDVGFVTKTDIDGNITFINDNYCTISGYKKDEVIGKTHELFALDDNNVKVYKTLWKTISEGKVYKSIFKSISKMGKPFYLDTSIYPIKNADGQIVEYILFSTNLTRYIDLITYDKLTGLRNRDTFRNDIIEGKTYMCIVVNIDKFSDITEFYGGIVGDNVIKEVAHRL